MRACDGVSEGSVLILISLDWFGLVWFGLVWFGLGRDGTGGGMLWW